jgi:serine/threonine-protein kinase ATR
MRRILKGMVTELGHQNAPLRGLAYTQVRGSFAIKIFCFDPHVVQLIALAKSRDASPYKLVGPYLPEISAFVVGHMLSAPMLLSQFTELIGVSRETFLKQNARLALPFLVRKGKTREIEEVAKASGVQTAMLLISASSDILTHLFLLPEEAAARGIDYLNTALKTQIKDYRFKTVIEMCMDPLLFSLVSEMGDPALEVRQVFRNICQT